MLDRTDRIYFPPSLTEQYVTKIGIDESSDAPQPMTTHLGTRCKKPRAAKRHFLDFRHHGGPHHCGRRAPEDVTSPNKRLSLLEKAHALETAEKDETDAAVNDEAGVAENDEDVYLQ